MEWFGPDWGAPVNKTCDRTETPTEPCARCGRDFTPADRGLVLPYAGEPYLDRQSLAFHLSCFGAMAGITT